MNDDLLTLARRAVACPRWRWMDGMHDSVGLLCHATARGWLYRDGEWMSWEARSPDIALPDLSDPATLGCLLALVREAYRVPCAAHLVQTGKTTTGYKFCYVRTGEDGWAFPSSVVPGREAVFAEYATEAAALVAALEAAP